MHEQYSQIVLNGSISIDRIMKFNGLFKDLIDPDRLDILSLSILLDDLIATEGGVAANIAHSLALLGETPQLLATIGPDGKDYLASLTTRGIDTTHVHESKEFLTSTFTVLTDAKNCQVGGFYPGAMADSDSLTLSPWHNTDSLIVISPYDPKTMARLVKETEDHDLPLVYDISQQVSNVPVEDLFNGLKTAQILFLNECELGILASRTEQTEDAIKSQVPIVVTTLGEKGSRIDGNSLASPLLIPAVQGLDVVDPTGAGDAYRAGFLYGYRRGWELELCAELATTTASFAIEHHGTQVHTFTKAEVESRFSKTFHHPLTL